MPSRQFWPGQRVSSNAFGRSGQSFGDRQTAKEKHARDLLEALNATAHSARTLWIAFLVVLAYMTVAIAGITHLDLLLGRPIRLPILQTEVGLNGFFVFSPGLILLLRLVSYFNSFFLPRNVGGLTSI